VGRDAEETGWRPAALAADVVAWRREQLRAAGFPEPQATALACDPRLDLHALIQLVERGCGPELAARIVAHDEPPPRSERPPRPARRPSSAR